MQLSRRQRRRRRRRRRRKHNLVIAERLSRVSTRLNILQRRSQLRIINRDRGSISQRDRGRTRPAGGRGRRPRRRGRTGRPSYRCRPSPRDRTGRRVMGRFAVVLIASRQQTRVAERIRQIRVAPILVLVALTMTTPPMTTQPLTRARPQPAKAPKPGPQATTQRTRDPRRGPRQTRQPAQRRTKPGQQRVGPTPEATTQRITQHITAPEIPTKITTTAEDVPATTTGIRRDGLHTTGRGRRGRTAPGRRTTRRLRLTQVRTVHNGISQRRKRLTLRLRIQRRSAENLSDLGKLGVDISLKLLLTRRSVEIRLPIDDLLDVTLQRIKRSSPFRRGRMRTQQRLS